MADYGLAVSWGDVKPGREKKALELWGEVVAFYDRAVADGRIERWDAALFEPSATAPGGVLRCHGTADQVQALAVSVDFLHLLGRAQQLLFNLGIRRFVTGQAMVDAFGRMSTIVESL